MDDAVGLAFARFHVAMLGVERKAVFPNLVANGRALVLATHVNALGRRTDGQWRCQARHLVAHHFAMAVPVCTSLPTAQVKHMLAKTFVPERHVLRIGAEANQRRLVALRLSAAVISDRVSARTRKSTIAKRVK
ncbi:MAG: hypothetical protein FJ395_11765 [Verrucomicrobia bacterium]|nr:hypothetical protein [Verrucomicrobiota bacterium]